MTISYELISALASGSFCSGERLAEALGVTRKAVWKRVGALRAAGLDVHAVRGKGYRLAQPIELLSRDAILAAASSGGCQVSPFVEVLGAADSTNTHAMARARAGAPTGTTIFAEWQQAGRGRRGRSWLSPFGANLYFSVIWRFDPPPQNIQLLGLAMGVALAERLKQTFAIEDLGVKWPNDLYHADRKLAGILLELSGEAGGECVVVVGVGVNVTMPASSDRLIDQPWTDLVRAIGSPVSRNGVAGICVGALFDALSRFPEDGFASFFPRWQTYDVLFGRPIAVHEGGRTIAGRAMGIDDSGALVLHTARGKKRFYSGDVSVRIEQQL